MTTDDVLAIFRDCGALLEGHFILSSGLRSPVFLQKAIHESMRLHPSSPTAGRRPTCPMHLPSGQDVTPEDLSKNAKPFPLAPFFKDMREQYEAKVQN